MFKMKASICSWRWFFDSNLVCRVLFSLVLVFLFVVVVVFLVEIFFMSVDSCVWRYDFLYTVLTEKQKENLK
jgi:hypothetical protein